MEPIGRKFSGEFSLICKHFGSCGSCFYFDKSYQSQLEDKLSKVQILLKPFYKGKIEVFQSQESSFRARAEFRIYKKEKKLSYAMFDIEKKLLPIEECPKVIDSIGSIAFDLLQEIEKEKHLSHKLYAVEFLSGLSGEVLVTLIYHKTLDERWLSLAKKLEKKFNIYIIGRSKKQKVVLSKEYICEVLKIDGEKYLYNHYEASFTQPNPKVNEEMIQWVIDNAAKKGDLLESYCGAGNFTIPLSKHYRSVLATEISKRSIDAAKQNCQLNGVTNINFVRLSSQELTQALQKVRVFQRLEGIDLDRYDFRTVLVDPPRAGLDSETIGLICDIEQIIYISCNPQTLCRDLETLCKTHKVISAAVFDQFAFSKHIECGVILQKKDF